MSAPTHSQNHESARNPLALAKEQAPSLRLTLLSVGLAALLILTTGLAIKTGSFLNRYEESHRGAKAPSVDPGPFAYLTLEDAHTVLVRLDANKPYSPTPAEISQLPTAEGITAFSLNPGTFFEPSLTDEEERGITDALNYFTSRDYTCGCMVVDLTTGQGIGFDYEKRVYGASAFKSIVSAYVCEELIDNGSHELASPLKELMERAITQSDNDSYRTLKTNYASGLSDWVSHMGIDPTYVARYRFPTYNAQESTALWAHVAQYLNSGSDTALWLGDLLTRTNVSHIRNAVERGLEDNLLRSQGEVKVQNKAGWISGSLNSTNDAGLVTINDHVYAISVMSDAPDCDESREASSEVALALLVAMQ